MCQSSYYLLKHGRYRAPPPPPQLQSSSRVPEPSTGCFWKYWHTCFRFLRDLMYVKAHVRCTRRKRDFWKFVWQHACFHSLGRITVRRKKRRHCNFTFNQNPAFWRKGVSGAVLNMKPCFPGTILFTLLRNAPEDDVLAFPRSCFRGERNKLECLKKAQLIRTLVMDDTMKSHRRCGAPWAAWASFLPLDGRWRREAHHPDAEGFVPRSWATVTIKGLQRRFGERSSPKAPPSRGHRGPRTLPHQLSTYGGACERKDLQTWTPKPLRAKSCGHEVCGGDYSSGVSQSCRRSAA